MDSKNKIILHIGGVYGHEKGSAEVFATNYSKLSQAVKDRLIIENDDKNYTIQDVLEISNITGAPVVFDNLHNKLNPSEDDKSEMVWIEKLKH